jgi:hypothetical protein
MLHPVHSGEQPQRIGQRALMEPRPCRQASPVGCPLTVQALPDSRYRRIVHCGVRRGERAVGEAGAVACQSPGGIDLRQLHTGTREVDAFGLPHLVESRLQDAARIRIEQSRRFGAIMHMPALARHVAGIAECLRCGRRIFVVLGAALGFLAEEFAVP